jgi:hypothetical protein
VLRRALPAVLAGLVLVACASGGSKLAATSSTTVTTSIAVATSTTATTVTVATTTGVPSTTRAPATIAPPATVPATTGPPATSHATTTTTAPAGVQLDAADNDQTVSVPPGGTVTVDLSSGELWSEPASSDSAVLNRTSGGVDASTGDATATFSAVGKGVAKITATHRCLPRPGMACAMYVALWSATVTVT